MKKIVRFIVVLLALGIVYTAAVGGFNDIIKGFVPFEYKLEISAAAAENELDAYFVAALCMTESGFREDASSGVARGLMQITDETAEYVSKHTDLEYEKRLEPRTNIRMGTWYFKYLSERFSDRKTALAAYNAGPNKVDSWLNNPEYSKDGVTLSKIPYSETRAYIRKVGAFYKIYKWLYK